MENRQDRTELHRSIWSMADDLRGSIDGWDFKQYVLGFMFYRYISENIVDYINKDEHEAENTDFNYENISDEMAETVREDIVNSKGFFILPSQLFSTIYKNLDNYQEDLNIKLSEIFKAIEDSSRGNYGEKNFKGLFDDIDLNSNKLGGTVIRRNEKLATLIKGIANINLTNLQGSKVDVFGDAYEYLMGMYASNAGKSGGEYFTPQEVSNLLTKLTIIDKKQVNKVYDPACGSGSLLLQSAKILGKENVTVGFYGQEKNPTTYNLCRINMFLHDIACDKFDIACEDTLLHPQHWDNEPFEVIVSNPPYSVKWEGSDNPLLINDERFAPAGVLAPKSKADLAFIMHSLAWLAPNGVAAIVCFPGIFYRGGAEQKIRKYLIDNNFIDSVIQLPENLFFGTSISTCIMILKKNKTDNKVLFIDASKEFVKVTNSNKLTEENINNIIQYYKDRKDIQYVSKLAFYEEIVEQTYNLSVSSYVEKEDANEKIDIKQLNAELDRIVKRNEVLRKEIAELIKELEYEGDN